MPKKDLLVLLALWTYVAIVVLGTMLMPITQGLIHTPATVWNGLIIWAMFFMAPLTVGWSICIPWRRLKAPFARLAA